MKRGLVVICATLLSGLPLAAQSVPASPDALRSSGTLDWELGTLELSVSAPLNPRSRNAPAEPHYREEAILRWLPSLVEEVLSTVLLDSSRTVGDVFESHPDTIGKIHDVADGIVPSYSRVAEDLSRIEVSFSLPLYPSVLEAVHNPSAPRPLPRVLGWQATDEFSGVVILARSPLPLRGEDGEALLRPALLPKVMDTALNPVLTAEHIVPDVFSERGVVSYTTSLDPEEWEDVVGSSPLRILAREAFGINRTDLIINQQDAARLLSTEANRRMLAAGRVLVVLSPDALDVSTSLLIHQP